MKKISRQAIRADAAREREERKKDQRQQFTELYNKTSLYNFPPTDGVNMDRFFNFPKIFGANDFGCRMTKAALAVYPVLCSRADFEINNWFQVSLENIAKMSGLSIPTTREAINHLVDTGYTLTSSVDGEKKTVPLLEMKKVTEGARHFFLYRAGFIRKAMMSTWVGDYFAFYTCLIGSGVWASLLPRGKCLYLSMRGVAEQNFELYCLIEGEIFFDMAEPTPDYYRLRKWDACVLPLSELARRVDISSNDLKKPLEQLTHHKLIERVSDKFKVYLRPKI